MTLLIRCVLFLLVFSIEVRVRAETIQLPESSSPLTHPAGCLKETKSVCAVETNDGEKITLKIASGTVVMSSGTTVIRDASEELRLLRGRIWVRPSAQKTISVRTEFGVARANTEYWVGREDEKMIISATNGSVEMLPRSSAEILTIPQGLENSLGRVDRDGTASVGLPTPLDPNAHLERWAKLYPGSKTAFEKDVAAFKATWTKGTIQATQIHQALFDRKIASIDAEAKVRAEAQRKRESRDRELRDRFRTKFLSGE